MSTPTEIDENGLKMILGSNFITLTPQDGVILDQANNNIANPIPNPPNDYRTRITKNTTTQNVDFCHLKNVTMVKTITPTISYTEDTLLSPIPVTNPVSTIDGLLTAGVRAVFRQNYKVLWATWNATSKIVYIQDYYSSTMNSIDLSTLPSANYQARLSLIGISQFIPVYYNSPTDCKFFIRLSENSAANNLYIITCIGNPLLISSYSYSTNYLGTSTPTFKTNGTSYLPLTTVANGANVVGQRLGIHLYIESDDVFIVTNNSNSPGGRYVQFINSQLTGVTSYNVDLVTILPSVTNPSSVIYHAHITTNIIANSFNNSVTTGINWLLLNYFNPTTKTFTRSLPANTITDLPNQFSNIANRFDSNSIDVGGLIYFYYIWIDSTNASNKTANLACYSWDKSLSTAPVFVSTKFIESLGSISTGSNTIYSLWQLYYSIKVNSLTNIEIFSSFCGATGSGDNGTLYVTTDNFTTTTALTVTNISLNNKVITRTEMDANYQIASNYGTIYPPHIFIRGPGINPDTSTVTDVKLLTVYPPAPSPIEYLTYDYNSATSKGTVSSTKDITYSANPLTIDASTIFNISNLTETTGYRNVVIKNNKLFNSNNFYGEYLQTGNQLFPASSATDIQLSTTDSQFGLTRTSNTISFNTIGLFKVGISMLVQESGGSGADFYFSFTDASGVVANSGTVFQIDGNNAKTLAYTEIVYNATVLSATIKLVGYTTSSGLTLTSYASPAVGIASSPAVILTIYQLE